MSIVFACPGANRVSEPERKWYVPNGKQADETTYCEECFAKHIKGTSTEADYYTLTRLHECNCDYPIEMNKELFSLRKQGIKTTFLNGKSQPFLEGASCTLVNDNNELKIVLPTVTEFSILLDCYIDGEYITIVSAMINSKPIINEPMKDPRSNYYLHSFDDQFANPVIDQQPLIFISEDDQPTTITIVVQKWSRNKETRKFSSNGDKIQFVFHLQCEQNESEKKAANTKHYQARVQILKKLMEDLTKRRAAELLEMEKLKQTVEKIDISISARMDQLSKLEQYK